MARTRYACVCSLFQVVPRKPFVALLGVPAPEQTIEQLFGGFCVGMDVSERDRLKFLKEATDEQLADVLRRGRIGEEIKIIFQDELIDRRHKQMNAQFEKVKTGLVELKKPHWTLVPTFCLVVLSAIAGVILAVMEILAWKK